MFWFQPPQLQIKPRSHLSHQSLVSYSIFFPLVSLHFPTTKLLLSQALQFFFWGGRGGTQGLIGAEYMLCR